MGQVPLLLLLQEHEIKKMPIQLKFTAKVQALPMLHYTCGKGHSEQMYIDN